MGTVSCRGQECFMRSETSDLNSAEATIQITSNISLLNPSHQPESNVCLCGQLTGNEWLLCLPFFYKCSVRVCGKLTGNQWFLCLCVGVQLSIHVHVCVVALLGNTHMLMRMRTHTLRVGQEEAGELSSLTSFFRFE